MKTTSKRPFARACRFVLRWILLPIVGLVLLLLLGLYLVCEFQQDYIAQLAEKHLREQTNLPFRVQGPVTPLFYPRPGVAVHNLRLAAADMALEESAPPEHPLLFLSALKVTVDPLVLFREGHLTHILLDGPLVTMAYATDGTPLWVPPQDPQAHASETGQATGSNLSKDLWQLTTPLSISEGGLRLLDPTGDEVLELRGIRARINPEAAMYPVRLQAGLRLLKGDMEMDFTLALGPTAANDTLNVARGRFTGSLRLTPPGSRTLEAELFSSLFVQKDGGLALPDFQITSEGDALTLHVAMDPEGPSVAGKAMVRSLSLPRWFNFGRNLPPGLQAALHNVSGPVDLRVDSRGVVVDNLNLKAGEMPVTGLVSVEDFSKPVVLVDVALDSVDLDEIFPFLALPDSLLPAPEEPVFNHPPLVPYPGPAAAEDLPDVGYDVRVAAARPIVHSLPTGPVLVKVYPVKDYTQVAFSCQDIMKGALDGILDIGETKVGMVYKTTNMDLAVLPENKDSSVKFQGKATGTVRMDIPVHADGAWDAVWKFKAVSRIDNLKVLIAAGKPWHLAAKRADVSLLEGKLNADRASGISLNGQWKVDAKDVAPSWNPKGTDALILEMNGGLFWPPFVPEVEHGRRVAVRGGIERITGTVSSTGTLHVPLGRRMAPVSGSLTGNLTWNAGLDILRLDKAVLDGLGSYFGANLVVDMRGKGTVITADGNFKLNPRVLLKEWNLLPGGGAQVPANISGTSKITASGDTIDFGKLDLQIDGTPATGMVKLSSIPATKNTLAEQLWTIRLTADQLDLDNYFPPAKPEEPVKPRSTEPWDLSAMQGVNIDAQITLKRTRLRKLAMQDMLVSAALQRNRFTFAFQAGKLYDGSGVFLAQGVLDPGAGRVTMNTVNLEVKSVALGKALADALADSSKSYGGTASLSVIASGSMGNEREIYSGMSGTWLMSIKDGLYPAFIGSDSGLRNTFNSASASGVLDKGVVRWDNFKLVGTMVDMNGDGMVDFGARDMDFTIYVTLARIPTVPVRFRGSFDAPSMNVRGAHMVVHTAKAAGLTVFDIFVGVLELPGRAVKGVGDLFSSETPAKEKDNSKNKDQKPAPKK